MKANTSLKNQRAILIINFIALLLFVIAFQITIFFGISVKQGLIISGVFLLIFTLSFIKVYVKTGLWRFTHTKIRNLDEYQIQVLLQSIRKSYVVFVIVVLLLIYVYALIDKGPINVVIAAALLYIAHILPSSILAWKKADTKGSF
jgi:hypothetical protein